MAAVKVEVRVSSFYYNGNGTRPEADVQVGDIVEWDWAQDLVQPHNVTFATLPLLLDNLDPKASSPRQLNSGAVWQVRFTRAGKYTYVCTIHQQMTGTVVVS